MEALRMTLEGGFVCEECEAPSSSEEECHGVKYALSKADWEASRLSGA